MAEGSGGGGKVRRKAVRKGQSTPYDRPPLGRNPSWVSKMIMDPASKLVNAGAQLFFSSLFRKRLTLSPSRGADQESRGTGQETAILSPAEDQRPTPNDNGKQCVREDQRFEMKDSGKQLTTNGGFSELELMLKQKTFTRSEIDHLTEVLHSRTVESSHGERSAGFSIQETVFDSRGLDRFSRSYLQETRNESHLDNSRFAERVPTAVVSSEVFEEDAATPAELAKAYMGNRSSKVSPSVLGLRTQATREDSVALYNSPFAPRSPVMSLVQKPIHGGVLENGFMTPRSQGRPAIYSMAHTPYSRNYPTATQKGSSSIYNGYGEPSSSPSTGFAREFVSRSVSKDLAQKRRSSVLEDEIGSVGPIRRLRQKTTLSTPKNTNLPIARTPFSSRGTGKANICMDPSSSSKTLQGSDDNGNIPGKSYSSVPSQSKETARKILLQLEKLTPKEKQNKADALGLGDNSPSKLMPNMTQGHSLRSLEDVDPSKLLQTAGYNLNSTQKGLLPDVCETSSSQKQDKVEENGQKSSSVSHGSFAPAGTVSGTFKYKDTVSPFSFSNPVKKQEVAQASQKKWGFQMTAHEDLLDLDDKIHSSEAAAFAKLAEKKNTLETTVLDIKAVPVTEEKTSVSEFKAPVVSSEFSKSTFLGTHNGTKVVDDRSGFMLSAASAASTSLPPVVSVSQSTTFTNNVPDKEPNAPPPLLSSGTKIDDKISPFTSSSSPFVNGSFSLKPTSPTEVKQDTTNSLVANASNVTETVPKPTESINSGAENTQNPEDTVGRPESLLSLPQSTSAPTNSLFTFSSKPSISSLSNGFLNSTTPSVFPSTAAFPEATPSTSATSSSILAPAFNFVSTSNSIPSATPTPSLPPTPDFKSGFSFMPPSIASTTSIATDLKASNEKEPSIANIPSSGNSVSTQSVSAFATSATSSTFVTSVSSPFTTGNSIYNSSISSGPASGNTAFSSVAFQNNSTSSSSMFNSSAASSSPFGLSTSAPSSTVFSFTAQAPPLVSFSSSAQTQPVFCSMPGGNYNNNNNQVTMEDDSMAEDEVQVASTPILTPTPSFAAFNSTVMFAPTLPSSSSGVNPFQFNGQQSQPIAQNPSPFQQSGSGSFSLGSGGGEDKSGRRMIKVKRRNGKK